MRTTYDFRNTDQEQWLKRYYYARAFFSIVWVTAAFAVGTKVPVMAALLLVVYPAWDAIANWIDAARSGGLDQNPPQRINVWVSSIAVVAVVVALNFEMNAVIAVIGAWAVVSGLLQLSTAVRRWKNHGAQWTMILSGAQSALAGGLFIAQSRTESPPSIANIAGYAGVGALYFLISGISLTVRHMRNKQPAL